MFRGKLHTLDFKNILYEMVIALQKMIFKVMVLDKIQKQIEERMSKGNIFKDILGVFTGGSTTTGTTLPGQAGGGTVQQGSPTLVGERGPELFVPNSAGSIKTNADTKQTMSGGGGVNVTQNLNFAVGITNTVRAEIMNMLPAIQQSTISAVADAKQRGGKFSKAFGA
jgi:phage-related minor tail protein